MFGAGGYEQVTAYFVFVIDRLIVAKCHSSVKVLLASWPTDRFT
jgi:hypothetical protein